MRQEIMERRAGSQRGRDTTAGLVAAVAHVALIILAVHIAGDPPPVPPPEQDDVPSIIEMHGLIPIEPLPAPVPTVAPEPDRTARGTAAGAGSRREELPDLPPSVGPERAPPVAGAAPSVTGDVYALPPAVPMPGDPLSIGTGSWGLSSTLPVGPDVPGAAAPGTARGTSPLAPKIPAAGPGATALRDAVLGRDRELGVGNPGATAIAHEVESAVRASGIPNESGAVLVARIGGDGVLLSLGVQRFESGDAAAWTGVAQAASAALGKRKLRLAGIGPKGAVVQIDVRSAMTYPSGSKDKVTPRLPSLTEGPPRDVAPAPSPDGDSCAPERWSPVKPLCGVGAKIGTFDVTDAVSRKHRSVRATFRVTLLDGAVALASPTTTTPAASTAPSTSATPTPPADAGAP